MFREFNPLLVVRDSNPSWRTETSGLKREALRRGREGRLSAKGAGQKGPGGGMVAREKGMGEDTRARKPLPGGRQRGRSSQASWVVTLIYVEIYKYKRIDPERVERILRN